MIQRSRNQLDESFGSYVRSQRQLARLSLRQAAELARISNPYLSQIEHGLALPSVRVLSALAEALQVSADTFLLRAAGVAPQCGAQRSTVTEDAIRHDPRLDDAQKRALLAVLATFVGTSSPRPTPTRADKRATPASTRAPRRRPPPGRPAPDGEEPDSD